MGCVPSKTNNNRSLEMAIFELSIKIMLQNIEKMRINDERKIQEILSTLPQKLFVVPTIEELKKELENCKKKLQIVYEESLPYK
jgi:hypothetical protein